MKKLLVVFLSALLLCALLGSAQAEVKQNPLLDAAFSCLEKDNIFQRRYNEITGAQVESLFEQGVPYFFGRQTDYTGTKLTNVVDLMSNYPNYAVRKMM